MAIFSGLCSVRLNLAKLGHLLRFMAQKFWDISQETSDASLSKAVLSKIGQ